jgi:peroxiredoxin
MSLRWGQPAPDFTLPSTDGRDISLAEFRGRSDVVLLFYCYDFGGI